MRRAATAIAAVLLFLFCGVSFSAETKASSFAVIEADSRSLISGKNENEKREPASTTKILTALVAIENAPLSSLFKVSKAAAEVEGSGIGLEEGEEVLLEDLLYMLLLKSGNDAAVVIAENIAGSVEKFAEMMNLRAKETGCKNSNFENPHGLHSENHYTTSYDLALIAAEALENETFARIVSTKMKTLDYKNLTVKNSNRLLSEDGFNGVKTGFTKAAGRCLVSSATKNGIMLVCVTMKDPDDWNDHRTLISDGFERVSTYELLKVGDFRVETDFFGGNNVGVFSNTKSVLGISVDGRKEKYEVKPRLFPVLFAPAKKGTVGGYLEILCNGRRVGISPLCLENDVQSVAAISDFELFLYNFGKILKILL